MSNGIKQYICKNAGTVVFTVVPKKKQKTKKTHTINPCNITSYFQSNPKNIAL